jgi:hypothetical protein
MRGILGVALRKHPHASIGGSVFVCWIAPFPLGCQGTGVSRTERAHNGRYFSTKPFLDVTADERLATTPVTTGGAATPASPTRLRSRDRGAVPPSAPNGGPPVPLVHPDRRRQFWTHAGRRSPAPYLPARPSLKACLDRRRIRFGGARQELRVLGRSGRRAGHSPWLRVFGNGYLLLRSEWVFGVMVSLIPNAASPNARLRLITAISPQFRFRTLAARVHATSDRTGPSANLKGSASSTHQASPPWS